MTMASLAPYKLDVADACLYHLPNWLSADEADRFFNALTEELAWSQDEIKVFGRWHRIPRLQAWHGNQGLAYTYSGKKMHATPWTPALYELKKKLSRLGMDFNSVLGNWYRDGHDKMGWHSDNERELGSQPVIASVSLGAERDFAFRRRGTGDKFILPLTHGSLLIMAANTQQHWQHSLPQRKRVTSSRINLTFRHIHE